MRVGEAMTNNFKVFSVNWPETEPMTSGSQGNHLAPKPLRWLTELKLYCTRQNRTSSDPCIICIHILVSINI